jgi:hypothetical protein
MTWPRRTRDGRLVPELAALLRGRREVARLRGLGMELDLSNEKVLELGWSLAVADVPTREDRAELAQLVAQLKERNRVERTRPVLAQALDRHGVQHQVQTAPDPGELLGPRSEHPDDDQQQAPGPGGSRARQVPDSPDWNEKFDPITAYLAQDQDDDHDWRPT